MLDHSHSKIWGSFLVASSAVARSGVGVIATGALRTWAGQSAQFGQSFAAAYRYLVRDRNSLHLTREGRVKGEETDRFWSSMAM